MARSRSVQLLNRVILISMVALVSSHSGAQTPSLDPGLVRSMLAFTTTFPREITVFHYAPRSDLGLPTTGPIDSTQSDIQKSAYAYRLQVIATYQDLKAPNANMGFNGVLMGPNGMYVAIDPAISRRWGGTNWSLQEMRIPALTRYFDGRVARPFTPDVQAYVRSLGCSLTTPRELITSSGLGCMKALRVITQATNSVAIAYWYLNKLLPMCSRGPTGSYGTAFVLIDPSAIDQVRVNVFARDIPSPDPLAEERQSILDFFSVTGKGTADFPGLKPSATPGSLNQWAQDHLYQCNSAVNE